LKQELDIKTQEETWLYARKYKDIATIIMSYYSKEFSSIDESDSKFLIKFSNPWDLQKAHNEEIPLPKLIELMKKCLRQKISIGRRDPKVKI
jgi:hypothetical protein